MNATKNQMSDAEILNRGLDLDEVKAARKIPVLTEDEALALAAKIAGDDATVTLHQGLRREMAIRVSGCFKDDAERIAREIAHALPGTLVADGGFVAVWF